MRFAADMLYTKPIPSNETFLPSPTDLQGFVIVKVTLNNTCYVDQVIYNMSTCTNLRLNACRRTLCLSGYWM